MKKYLKRISALLVAMAMVMTMCVTALAAEVKHGSVNDTLVGSVTGNIASASDNGKITVNDVTSGTITAYKVVSAEYEGGYFKGYKSEVPGMTLSTDEQNCVVLSKSPAELTAMITGQNPPTLVSYTNLDDLPIGVYIIVVSNVKDGRVYNPMMGSVYYDPATNGTTIQATTITAKYLDGGTIEKTISKVDNEAVTNTKETTDIGLGSEIEFKLKGFVPDYDANMYTAPVYVLTDTLSAGLEYVDNSIVLPATISQNDVAIAENKREITITLSAEEVFALGGSNIEITYKAKVTKDAVVKTDMDNTVVLEYSTTPTEKGTATDITHQYTFEINGDLTKVDEKGTALADAVFTLYNDEECTDAYQRLDEKTGEMADLTAKTGTDGDIEFLRIPAGTYFIKETTAPDTYQLTGKVFKVEIVPTINADYSVTASVTITDMDTSSAADQVVNTKLSSLPSTGSIGTYLFTLIGVVIMATTAGIFFVKRRRNAK